VRCTAPLPPQIARQYEEEGWIDPSSFAELPEDAAEVDRASSGLKSILASQAWCRCVALVCVLLRCKQPPLAGRWSLLHGTLLR